MLRPGIGPGTRAAACRRRAAARPRCRRRRGPSRARSRWRCSAARRAAGRGGSSPRASCPARRTPRARGAAWPAAPSRVAPTISGSASSERIAQQMISERPKTGAALAGRREPAEALLGEERQPEQREHDARRARDHLDAGLDRPREPRAACRTRSARPRSRRRAARRSRAPRARSAACRGSGPGSRPTSTGRSRPAGAQTSRSGRRYCDALEGHEEHDRGRRSRSAQPAAQHSGEHAAGRRSGQAREEPAGSVRAHARDSKAAQAPPHGPAGDREDRRSRP